jgi:hypothetical protein
MDKDTKIAHKLALEKLTKQLELDKKKRQKRRNKKKTNTK